MRPLPLALILQTVASLQARLDGPRRFIVDGARDLLLTPLSEGTKRRMAKPHTQTDKIQLCCCFGQLFSMAAPPGPATNAAPRAATGGDRRWLKGLWRAGGHNKPLHNLQVR